MNDMRSRPIRTALVGTGYIAEFHARGIRTLPDVELVSVCDTNLRTARLFAAEWGIPTAFDSLDAMLESQRLDALHVLTPPDSHYPLAKAALQRGVSVFLEKPISTTADEADQLLRIAHD